MNECDFCYEESVVFNYEDEQGCTHDLCNDHYREKEELTDMY